MLFRSEPFHPSDSRTCGLCSSGIYPEQTCQYLLWADRSGSTKLAMSICQTCQTKSRETLESEAREIYTKSRNVVS